MSTQPRTPHPDPNVPWLDLSNGIPDWLAEYKIQSGRTLKDVHTNAMLGYANVLTGKDITLIVEELIRYREAYHAARRDEMTRLTQVLDANDAVKNSLRQERDYAVKESSSRVREIAELRRERDALLRAGAAMEIALTRTYSIHGSDDAKIEVLPIGCELPEYPEYEHKVFNWLSEDEFRAKLREMGEQGWKLISHTIDVEGTITHYCVFGRKS